MHVNILVYSVFEKALNLLTLKCFEDPSFSKMIDYAKLLNYLHVVE